MSEIISISSSVSNGLSIVEVLPLLTVKLESSEVGTPGVVVNHTVHINDLDSFLHGKPCTIVRQTKHSMDCSRTYEYRFYACGCSFCLNLIYDIAKKMVVVKE
jgi:hypothetical protein